MVTNIPPAGFHSFGHSPIDPDLAKLRQDIVNWDPRGGDDASNNALKMPVLQAFDNWVSQGKTKTQITELMKEKFFNDQTNSHGNHQDIYMGVSAASAQAGADLMQIFGLTAPKPTTMDLIYLKVSDKLWSLQGTPQDDPRNIIQSLQQHIREMGSYGKMEDLQNWAHDFMNGSDFKNSPSDIQDYFKSKVGL